MWGEANDNYNQVYNDDNSNNNNNGDDNQSSLGHEVIAGGAAFAGFKAFEDHQRSEGKPVEHQFAKEALAGFTGAEVDKLAETKGEDFVDREKAKRDAQQQAGDMYDDHYGGSDRYDPSNQGPPEQLQQQFGNQW
ncbi:hypothetical protein AAFC00_006107 [Neodothiora populina]|uniref:Uncharacterized protein n=1 Tax=Neodothiora populina TaxID=2781224 RepID=A0ABR3P482_9PEZI